MSTMWQVIGLLLFCGIGTAFMVCAERWRNK